MLSDEAMFERMKNGWRGGLADGTACGFGSTHENTQLVRAWLKDIATRYGIRVLNDAGAGDLHWIRSIERYFADVLYFDLVPRAPDVVKLDITREVMPPCDAILCRHVLNHLDFPRIEMALRLFVDSADYLIATQFDRYDGSKEFTRLDLRKWLGDYLECSDDGGAAGCKLAIWSL